MDIERIRRMAAEVFDPQDDGSNFDDLRKAKIDNFNDCGYFGKKPDPDSILRKGEGD